ncbi:MAG: guanylate kinase [Desulfobacteraceae bacterium 4572_123]|nr:MAG: guanylate kinase [Desulfobacteraceae bacterium 4572_123]
MVSKIGTKDKKGALFIVSAPSGAGKTTLCKAVRNRFPDIGYSVSHTTREPREGEKDGIDYHFITTDDFEKKIRQGKWAEWARVHGNYYGTSADFLNRCMDSGQDILLDIDVQGMRQITAGFPDSITFFIMPPTLEVLRERIETRGTDTKEVIERRIKNARAEMDLRHLYRHVVVNNQLDAAIAELATLIASYR